MAQGHTGSSEDRASRKIVGEYTRALTLRAIDMSYKRYKFTAMLIQTFFISSQVMVSFFLHNLIREELRLVAALIKGPIFFSALLTFAIISGRINTLILYRDTSISYLVYAHPFVLAFVHLPMTFFFLSVSRRMNCAILASQSLVSLGYLCLCMSKVYSCRRISEHLMFALFQCLIVALFVMLVFSYIWNLDISMHF
jgi:hypothetical protein